MTATEVHHVRYPDGWYLWNFPLDSPLIQLLCWKCHRLATLRQAIETHNYRLARQIKHQLGREQLWLKFGEQLDEAA